MTSESRSNTLDAPQTVRWHAYSSTTALMTAVAGRLTVLARDAITARGRFDIVLAGGETPRALYQLLTQADAEWSRWHIWFGDERCLPVDDPSRNDSMARSAWLAQVPIPPDHICPLDAPDASIRLAAVPVFDLVLLGLGEDGHTASLFPGHDWGQMPASPSILSVAHAPKPPPARLTLSAARLSAARQVWYLVDGAHKQAALQRWRAGEPLPAAAICPPDGVDVFHTQG